MDDEHVGHGARRRGPGTDDHRGGVDVTPSDAGFARCGVTRRHRPAGRGVRDVVGQHARRDVPAAGSSRACRGADADRRPTPGPLQQLRPLRRRRRQHRHRLDARRRISFDPRRRGRRLADARRDPRTAEHRRRRPGFGPPPPRRCPAGSPTRRLRHRPGVGAGPRPPALRRAANRHDHRVGLRR